MKPSMLHINEQRAAAAFDEQSLLFDSLYSEDRIISYKRNRVRQHVLQFLKPFSNILELNAGTGEDAIFFASHGHSVHATDISAGMQQQLTLKVKQHDLCDSVSTALCSYTQLCNLQNRGPFNHIFSNFAGLNCTHELGKVLRSFDDILAPGGMVTLVILPRFCLWEMLLIFKGKFRTATRRFFAASGRKAHVEGVHFNCWYYSPQFIQAIMKDSFEVVKLEGLCTIVPPSYIVGFAEKYPRLYAFLVRKEDKYNSSWPWKYIGDYYIITLKKKPAS